jgi:hypothetical protein
MVIQVPEEVFNLGPNSNPPLENGLPENCGEAVLGPSYT